MPPGQDDGLNSLDNLDKKIKEARKRHMPQIDRARAQGLSFAGRVIAELAAGCITGGFIGYWLDIWLDSQPYLFMLFLLLGAAGGMLTIYRLASQDISDNNVSAPAENGAKNDQ